MTSGFHPTVWGDYFIDYNSPPLQRSEEWIKERTEQLKVEVSGLFGMSKDVVEKMNLVDVLQHLGIDHHFQKQISDAMSSIHRAKINSSNLHDVSLRFRLLRQDGLWISQDEFNKFKGDDGRFRVEIIEDPRGMLSLYNAAHLLTHGEDVLEDAILFSRHHLESVACKLEPPLSEQIKRALQIPLPKALKRLETWHYILEYEKEEAYNSSLSELSKIDFNLLQRFHVKELKTISEWWKNLEVGLNYARDRIVECYFWSHSVYHEQEHKRARMVLAKSFALASLLDDTYDTYATLEESQKLNEAIQRWNPSYVCLLPEYLKRYYLKLIENFREIEDELDPREKFRVDYYKNVFQKLSGYYFQEAEWFHHNYVPSFEEHLGLSVMNTGTPMLCVALLVGMGDVATKEAFEWVISCTGAVKACGEVTRFVDDLAAFKHGKNKMDMVTCVECYINENNVAEEVAISIIESLVEDAWKNTNQEYLECGPLLPIVKRVSNMTKSMLFLFQNRRDGYTFSNYVKDTIEQQFLKPIPL